MDMIDIIAAKALCGEGGGGFTPTETQLTAMNSGIDSEKVAQIGTNTTNILLTQGKFNPVMFQNGAISNGNIIDRSYAVVNTNTLTYPIDIVIDAASGFNATVWLYPQGVSASAKEYNGAVIPANTPFRIVIARSVIDTSETANINTFVNAIVFKASEIDYDYINHKSQSIKKEKLENITYIDLFDIASNIDRRNSIEAGYDYNAVQNRVNQLM